MDVSAFTSNGELGTLALGWFVFKRAAPHLAEEL